MSTDSLHSALTATLWRAEQLEEQGINSAPFAWAKVSLLEEELAKAIPVSPAGRTSPAAARSGRR